MNQYGSKWISKKKRLAINLRDGFSCAYCGADLRGTDKANCTLDHLVCRTDGGSNEASNLVTACRRCNSQRGAKAWTDYATGGAIARIEVLVTLPLNLKLAAALIAGTAGDAAVEALR